MSNFHYNLLPHQLDFFAEPKETCSQVFPVILNQVEPPPLEDLICEGFNGLEGGALEPMGDLDPFGDFDPPLDPGLGP